MVANQVDACLEGSVAGLALAVYWKRRQGVSSELVQLTFSLYSCELILFIGSGTSVGTADKQ